MYFLLSLNALNAFYDSIKLSGIIIVKTSLAAAAPKVVIHVISKAINWYAT